jgi:MFS superfamily sulfate permease-like transporter
VNLAVAVGAGVVLSALIFSWEQAQTMLLEKVEFEPLLEGEDEAFIHPKTKSNASDTKNVEADVMAVVRAEAESSNVSFTTLSKDDVKVYELKGPLFFGSAQRFAQMFDYVNDPKHVELHFGKAHAADYSALTAINTVARKYHSMGKKFRLRAVHETSLRAFRKAGQLMFLNDKKLGHEALASELIALSEVPHWTVPKGYKEETREEETQGRGVSKSDSASDGTRTDQLDSV